jgi:alpha-galactosidase
MELAIIGAGSHFTLHLLRSLYQSASHDDYHVRLMDVRPEPLDALASLLPRLNALAGRRLRYSCHRERASALEGAEHVLVSFAVDFPSSFLRTCWVMHDHGIRFVEGETATPGALMATLRHLPPLLGIADDVRRYSDRAWLHVINNPMPRLILGLLRGTGYDRVVGHCHGTIQTRDRIAELTDTPSEQIDLFVAGINHFHLVQRAVDRRDGRDLLAALAGLPKGKHAWWEAHDFTQRRLYLELGDLLGCGHWHNFDYVPYSNTRLFRHADYNTWERYCLAAQSRRQAGTSGEIGGNLADDSALRAFLDTPEREQMFAIMRALSGETPPYFYLAGNTPNAGHVPNLPDGAVVELPSTVTPDGLVLERCQAPLPLYFETWLRQQLAVHELSVRAALEGSRRAAVEAIACDPSFRDCDCPPGQLLDEMLAANQGLVPPLA